MKFFLLILFAQVLALPAGERIWPGLRGMFKSAPVAEGLGQDVTQKVGLRTTIKQKWNVMIGKEPKAAPPASPQVVETVQTGTKNPRRFANARKRLTNFIRKKPKPIPDSLKVPAENRGSVKAPVDPPADSSHQPTTPVVLNHNVQPIEITSAEAKVRPQTMNEKPQALPESKLASALKAKEKQEDFERTRRFLFKEIPSTLDGLKNQFETLFFFYRFGRVQAHHAEIKTRLTLLKDLIEQKEAENTWWNLPGRIIGWFWS